MAAKEKPRAPEVDPEALRLTSEDAAAWVAYGDAVVAGLPATLRRARFGLALAATRRLQEYEMARTGVRADGVS